jgi:hypothetical protein
MRTDTWPWKGGAKVEKVKEEQKRMYNVHERVVEKADELDALEEDG